MTNVTDGQTVFVRDATTDTFKIAATSGGTAINIGTGHNAQTFTIVTDAVQGTAVANLGLGVPFRVFGIKVFTQDTDLEKPCAFHYP